MGPGVTESLEKDTLGHAGTAEQAVIYSELLEKLIEEQKLQQNRQKQSVTKVTAP